MASGSLTRVRGFLIGSGLVIAGAVVASGLVVSSFFRDHLLGYETSRSAEIVLSEARQELTPDVFASPRGPKDAVRFSRLADGLGDFFRVKAFDRNGVIVWSNEPRLIGQAFPEDPDFQAARAGDMRTEIGKPSGAGHRYEQTGAWVAELWVPVTFPGSSHVVGVLEMYRDVTAVMDVISHTQRLVWLVVCATGVVTWVGLVLVASDASASEARAIRTLEQQNRELTLLQRVTAQLLRPLDPAHVAESVVANAVSGLGLARAAIYRVGAAGPSLLAAWPAAGAPPPPPMRPGRASGGSRTVMADGTVAVPLTTHKGVTHVFVGDLGPVPHAGELRRSLDIMLDETAMALANAELFVEIREANERLSAIVAGIADRMLIVDRDMRVVWMNAVSQDASAPRADVVGGPCFSALGVDGEACAECPAARTLHSGQVERGVRVERTASGEARYMDVVTAPLRDGSGRIYQVLELARDITELVRMEERLKETNQALVDAQTKLVKKERLAAIGQVVVALHHTILNPLTGILGALQVLKADDVAGEARREALAAAEAEVRKIERLVRQLADLRRAEQVPYVGTTTMLDLE